MTAYLAKLHFRKIHDLLVSVEGEGRIEGLLEDEVRIHHPQTGEPLVSKLEAFPCQSEGCQQEERHNRDDGEEIDIVQAALQHLSLQKHPMYKA